MRSTPIFLLLGAALFNCASLTPYATNACHNRVVDTGEDCDDETNPQCVECRLRCESETTMCPEGWGCGVDKICRQMTGELKDATAAVSSNVFTLQSGDFDGDGRVDVLGSPPFGSAGGSRVHYFDRDSSLSSVTTLDVSIPIPVVKDINGDKIADIGFAVRNLATGAFAALSGQADRTFSTIVFPSVTYAQTDTRLAVINATPPTIRLPFGLPSVAIGLRSDKNGDKIVSTSAASFASLVPQLSLDVNFATSSIEGQPKFGRIFPEESPCGQIVFTTANGVAILSPCEAVGGTVQWRTTPLIKTIAFPNRLSEEIYVGPVASSDRDEIVIRTEGAPAFYRYAPGDKTADPDKFVARTPFSPATGLPLASGDLDGDGVTDFVFAGGISLSSPDPLIQDAGAGYKPPDETKDWRSVAPRDQLRWSAARIGRFNNDDRLDVLVSFANSLDVDVMGNVGGGRFTPFTVRSEQVVRGIASGDFDGDLIEDVAFFQSATELTTGDEATLTLAFGSAVGGPEAPRTTGKFKNPRAFSAFRGENGTDNIAVLQISPDAQQSPTSSFSVLLGNGGRQQVAPLLFTTDQKDSARIWAPASFSIGSFTAANTTSILAIAAGFVLVADESAARGIKLSDPKTSAWLARPDATVVGGLAPFDQVYNVQDIAAVDFDSIQSGRRDLRIVSTVGDIDVPTDGVDELINMGVTSGGKDVAVVVVKNGVTSTVATIPGARAEEGDPLELIDLDRDGFLDLVYVIRVGNRRVLSVLRGNGTGGFVTTPITTDGTDLKGEAIGFAKFDAGSRVIKIALVTNNELWIADLKDGKFQVTDASKVLGTARNGITGIVSGDINGDGISDLAIAQGGGVRVIAQRPTTE